MTIMKLFAAEILFLDPRRVPDAVTELEAHGCAYQEDPDAIDDYGPTEFGMVTGWTALSLDELGSWVGDIIDRFGGDVVQWNYGEPWKIGDHQTGE
jgi:hypothetical protein